MTTSNKMRIDLDPRLLANQSKILKYLSHITEEQKAQKQMLRTLMHETQKFQGDVYQSFKIIDHKIQQVIENVDSVEETSEHINIRVKSMYKHMKGVGSNSDLLQPDTQSRMFNSLQGSMSRSHPKRSNEMVLSRHANDAIPTRVLADFSQSGSDIDANEHEPEQEPGATSNVPFSNLSVLSKPLNSPVQRQKTSSNRTSKQRLPPSSNIQESEIVTSSPLPISNDPPQDTHRPSTRKPKQSQPSANQDFLDTSVIKRAHHTKRRLIEANPRGKDIKKLAENNDFELSKASIAAISEALKNSNATTPQTVGLHTVLVLDTSASMEGHVLNTLKTFVNGMLDGIDSSAGELGLEEHVAIITCGSNVQVSQTFTNDYLAVRNIIDNLFTLNGRTPLVAALSLALCYLEIKGETLEMMSHKIPPRVVVVSDFHVTSDRTFTGQDQDSSEVRINSQQQIFQLARLFMRSGYPIYCVPVRDSNQSVCEGLATSSGGLIIPVSEPMMGGQYYRYQLVIGSVIERYNLAMSSGNDEDIEMLIREYLPKASLTQNDYDSVYKLFLQAVERSDDNGDLDELSQEIDQPRSSPNHGGPRIETPITDEEVDPASLLPISQEPAREVSRVPTPDVRRPSPRSTVQEESEQAASLPDWIVPPSMEAISFEERADLPMLGSRVVRGDDWKWGDQDGNGPGTVIGHEKKGLVYILWDNTNTFGTYRYRFEGVKFDLKVFIEPRNVPEGSIEVGCWAKRGPDWSRGDEDGGEGTVGVVIRKLPNRTVVVRWPSRVIETYNFGKDNKWELEATVSKPLLSFEAAPTEDMTLQERPSVLGEEESVPCWFWMDSSSQWRIFPEEANQKLESTFSIKPQSNVMVHRKNENVKVFFAQMQCEIKGKRCKIDRSMKTETEIQSLREIEEKLPDP